MIQILFKYLFMKKIYTIFSQIDFYMIRYNMYNILVIGITPLKQQFRIEYWSSVKSDGCICTYLRMYGMHSEIFCLMLSYYFARNLFTQTVCQLKNPF